MADTAPRDNRTPTRPASKPTPATLPAPCRAVYTVAEAAHMLSLSLASTYDLLRRGDLPGRRLGRRWVIPRDRFHTWLDNLPAADPHDTDPADGQDNQP
ncbi:hypothetical protein ThrDRAFT_04680 [Frankia casuarinae]|uniref:Excisionase/Xis, DNA-binding n=1 Tax=Frankia casuarinae (strain DSM 45818 / CECT 9043 / HFP020203 / CcI3) TaxID=106370 RepID=Q2JDR4_FRACC|nr:helix-turn-helix domain-containing protein [Frankia casuarinae]ABD10578.1 Excisionase/Xis, DNA-binding [Frankia casuarinae]EYT89693.1 hypothetical protein ThrDRAFT_04680 [Frankia casuarinae]